MKTRSIILVVATLIIGFILGMLTSAQIRNHRLKPVRVFFSADRFREGFYRTIKPDEQQKVKIDLVLNKYVKINSELQDNFRKEFDTNMKELRKELDSILTKEQLARLKEMDEKRQEMVSKFRKEHGRDTLIRRNGRWSNPEGGPLPEGRPSPEGFPPPPPERDDSTGLPNHK
jgi:hypothetical protein